MVITTHIIHKLACESKNDKVPENPDSAIIKSFLKNSQELEDSKKVISSHS